MKKCIYALCCLLILKEACANPTSFITTWTISEDDLSLSLPIIDSGDYNFTIDYGDATEIETIQGFWSVTTHSYSAPGTYDVNMTGHIVGIKVIEQDVAKLVNIGQWGNVNLGNEGYCFKECSNLDITAMDALNLTSVTNLDSVFYGATALTFDPGAIQAWDTSRITNLHALFSQAYSFNADIGSWDVSRSTYIYNLYILCYVINLSHFAFSLFIS